MAKFLAKLFILTGLFACSLGNYWFTFGLWPISWKSFALFFALTTVLTGLNLAIEAEKK